MWPVLIFLCWPQCDSFCFQDHAWILLMLFCLVVCLSFGVTEDIMPFWLKCLGFLCDSGLLIVFCFTPWCAGAVSGGLYLWRDRVPLHTVWRPLLFWVRQLQCLPPEPAGGDCLLYQFVWQSGPKQSEEVGESSCTTSPPKTQGGTWQRWSPNYWVLIVWLIMFF